MNKEWSTASQAAYNAQPRCNICSVRLLLDGKCPNRGCYKGYEWLGEDSKQPVHVLVTKRFLFWTWSSPHVIYINKPFVSDYELGLMLAERDSVWSKL